MGLVSAMPELDPPAVAEIGTRLQENIASAVKAPDRVVRDLLVALLAEGHVLIEDYPGVGKTALARALARSLDAEYARIQCTADLLPADVVGTNVFNQREGRFEFRPGPVFANVVLVDEVNRASPKTQSGLLECMQERHVTVDVHTHELARPFIVLATQNPIEYEGTYPLPEAQLDRFTMRISLGYPPLGDEINRAPAKTQSALLEAMQERQVTTEGTTRQLPRPFLVIATQNPIEYEGTYPLPEAQLDRFLIRLRLGYPSGDDEVAILRARIERAEEEVRLKPVVDAATLSRMQAGVEQVHVAESIARYVVALVAATRSSTRLQVGASPRGSLALLKLSRARAAMDARDYVVPDDVKSAAVPALAHRLVLRPELWVQRIRAEAVIEECLASVPAPSAEDAALAP